MESLSISGIILPAAGLKSIIRPLLSVTRTPSPMFSKITSLARGTMSSSLYRKSAREKMTPLRERAKGLMSRPCGATLNM